GGRTLGAYGVAQKVQVRTPRPLAPRPRLVVRSGRTPPSVTQPVIKMHDVVPCCAAWFACKLVCRPAERTAALVTAKNPQSMSRQCSIAASIRIRSPGQSQGLFFFGPCLSARFDEAWSFLPCAFIPQRVSTLARPSACFDVDYFLWRLALTTFQLRESLCILKNGLQCCRPYAESIR